MDANRADRLVGVHGIGDAESVEPRPIDAIEREIQERRDGSDADGRIGGALDLRVDAERRTLIRFDVNVGGMKGSAAIDQRKDDVGPSVADRHSMTPASRASSLTMRPSSTCGASAVRYASRSPGPT